jgi:translation initiation factor 2 subunit 3
MSLESQKVYVNIGLVGHVANGKTTLVKALTNVNTKRSSSEVKSGRTIKLGYANCIIWKCPICETVQTTGQDQKKVDCCSFDLEPSQHVSFIDAPGHHSYVHTMIKGTAIIDAAIIVEDCRVTTLQPQTLEHLIILEVLGVRNVIVIQNKIDLATPVQIRNNWEMMKREFKGTVADGAPIIPISAQSRIGIDTVQDYLSRMVTFALKNMKKFTSNVFTVIRSFDINKPDTGVEELRGGVLGGTVTGESGYKIGDEIEIRPGYLSGQTYHPLKTKILTIFSESKSCKDMGRGGLYGIGTRLDPCLTKADRLVGSLAGFPDQLPPLLTEIDIKVIGLKNVPRIKSGNVYQLIIGSNVVRAVAKKSTNGQGDASKSSPKTTIMVLHKPICTVDKKCLIYSTDAATQLLGLGLFGTELETDVGPVGQTQTEEEYTSLLPGSEKKKREKINLPIPTLSKENRDTIWGNMSMFCQTLRREPDHLTTYIRQELCVEASICQNGLKIFKTKMTVQKFQTVLKKYIKEQVCCGQCHGVDTEIRRNAVVRSAEIHCITCGSDTLMLK